MRATTIPIMQPRMFRRTVQLFALLLLSNAAVGMAGNIPYHHCFYDEIHKRNVRYHMVKEETGDDSDSDVGDEKASPMFEPLRVKFSMHDLKEDKEEDKSKGYCKDDQASVKDVHGVEVKCEEKDILTSRKKSDLLKIVRSAVNMHTARLKVKKMQGPIKVPELVGPLCKLFTVSKDHKNTGVSDADFVLYVSSRPSSKAKMFAAGAPCAATPSRRPVVGVLMYTTEHIQFTAYSVRVAAHEIAHALGFTHTIMKNKIGKHMKSFPLRHKPQSEEIHTENVVKFVQKQYACGQKWAIEIEDEKGALLVPSHSHWKRRNALEELMAPIVTAGYYTYLTLALFHDLGFYEANFSSAEEMEWGKDGGCDFIQYRCVGDGVDNARYFCSDKDTPTQHCAPGRRGMGTCSNIVRNDQMPYAYRYFWQYNWRGVYYQYYTGEESLMTDRCPIYEEKDDLSCTNPESKAPGVKGEDSWCVRNYNGKVHSDVSGERCAQVEITDGEMYVKASNNSHSAKCKGNGYFRAAKIMVGGETVELECPSMRAVQQEGEMKQLMKKAEGKDDFKNEFKEDDKGDDQEEEEDKEEDDDEGGGDAGESLQRLRLKL